jgi:peptidoglycan/LPS O-acetylase OafA/YrhL
VPMSTKTDFIHSFLFLKNLPLPNEKFTAHLWTLAVEEQFYIILPLLLVLNIDYFFVIAVFLVTVFPIICILNHSFPALLPHSFPFTYVIKLVNYIFWKGPIILLVGSVAAILTFKGITIFKTSRRTYFLSFFVLLLAIIVSSKKTLVYHKYLSEYVSAIMYAYVILLNVQTTNFLSKFLSNRILSKIGVLSFSIYIWQELFIGKLFWIPCLQWLNPYPFGVVVVAKLVLIFPMAYCSYRFLEKPFLRLKGRYSTKTPTASPNPPNFRNPPSPRRGY